MKQKKKIQLAENDVVAVLRDLEVLVVSFDRIGSEFSDDPQRHAIETDKFLFETFAFKKLARMRRILSDAYDAQRSKAAVRRLEERLEKTKVWPKHEHVRRKVPPPPLWQRHSGRKGSA